MLSRISALAAVGVLFGLGAAAQQPKEVSGREQSKKLVSQVRPVYPPEAKAAGTQGLVRLEAVIASDGKVSSIRTVSGPPELIQSAVDAVKQWVYEPTVLDGAPVEVMTQIDVNYRLDGARAAAAEKPPLDVSGSAQQSKLIDKVRPTYPPEAKAAGIEGLVRLEVVIGADGAVKSIRTVSGPPELIQSAVEAVRQWTYQPTLLNGEPVEVITQIDVNYTLSR